MRERPLYLRYERVRCFRRTAHGGVLFVIITRDEAKTPGGVLTYLWHLSISHPNRHPIWEEIAEARYDLLPDNVTMAMVLPPRGEYVNVHKHCFHLHELHEKPHLTGAF